MLHLAELVRVARDRVVLCCPLGSAPHVEAERELAAWHRGVTGEPHRFLEEHLERGLPSEEELAELAHVVGISHRLWFHGDFRRASRLFMLNTLAKRRAPSALASYAFRRLDPRRDALLEPASNAFTNRVFLVGRPPVAAL